MKQYGAECLGTFWLVFGGCGSAALAALQPWRFWVASMIVGALPAALACHGIAGKER